MFRENTKIANRVFVFGSNLAGRHGKGSALHAKQYFGALQGNGEGIQGIGPKGTSYAIPTKDETLEVHSLRRIKINVEKFIAFANAHKDMEFFIVKIGTGLAGYKDEDIVYMFVEAPNNCIFHTDWEALLNPSPEERIRQLEEAIYNIYMGYNVAASNGTLQGVITRHMLPPIYAARKILRRTKQGNNLSMRGK